MLRQSCRRKPFRSRNSAGASNTLAISKPLNLVLRIPISIWDYRRILPICLWFGLFSWSGCYSSQKDRSIGDAYIANHPPDSQSSHAMDYGIGSESSMIEEDSGSTLPSFDADIDRPSGREIVDAESGDTSFERSRLDSDTRLTPDAASDAALDAEPEAASRLCPAIVDDFPYTPDEPDSPSLQERDGLAPTALGPCAFEIESVNNSSTGGANCSDGVYRGDVTITGTNEIQMLAGCSRLSGNLTVLSDTLTNLSGLEKLHVIDGELFISNVGGCGRMGCWDRNPLLESYKGLEGLKCVGGDVYLEHRTV